MTSFPLRPKMYRRARSVPSAIVLLLFCFFCACLQGRGQSAGIQSPSNGAVDVSRQPQIVIQTSTVIDTTKLNYLFPDRDSVYYNLRPNVMVIPKDVYDSLADSYWYRYAVDGQISLSPNKKTLTFQPKMLAYSTRYKVVVNNLYSASPAGIYPTVVSTFRTVDPPHDVAATSLDGYNVINCHDSIVVYFNRSVTSASTQAGPIIDVARIVSVDTVLGVSTASAGSTVTIDPSNPQLVYVQVSNATPGQHYLLNLHVSRLSGVSTDDKSLHFFVQNAFRVRVQSQLSNSSDSLPFGINEQIGVGDSYYTIDDTVKISALPKLDGVRFNHWQCAQFSLIDNSTSSSISFTQSCAQVTNVTLVAVYEKMSTRAVQVSADSGLQIVVYDREYNVLGTTGSYIIHDDPDDSLTIRAVPFGGYGFDHWDTNPPLSPPFNPYGNPIKIKFPSLTTATATFTGKQNVIVSAVTYSLSGMVIVDDGSTPYIFTTPSSYTELTPGSRTIGIQLTDDCYEIYKGVDDSGPHDFNPTVQSASLTGQLTQNGNIVAFFIRKKKIHVRVEQIMLKDVDNDIEDPDVKVTHQNATEVFRKVNGQWIGPLVAAVQYDNGHPFKDYEFNCNDDIKIVCNDAPKVGHYFSHWSDNIANYISPGNRASRSYEFTVNESSAQFTAADGHKQIRTRACFYEVFRLVEVGLYLLKTSGSFELEYFPPEAIYVMKDDEPRDGRQVQFMSGEGTRIHFRFNEPYDKSSVTGALTSWPTTHGITASEPSYIVSNVGYDNVSYIIQDGYTEANELIFGLHVNNNAASKMSYDFIRLTNMIQSKTGLALENSMNFSVELELPQVRLEYVKLRIHDDDEDPNAPFTDRGDMFSIYQSAIMGPDNNGQGQFTQVSTYKGQVPNCSGCNDQLEANEEKTYNFTLLESGVRMKHHGYIFSTLETKDKDGSGLINTVGSILSSLGTLISGITLPALPEKKDAQGKVIPPSFWEQALHDNAIKVAGGLFKMIGDYLANCSCNEDDHIGSAHIFLGKLYQWGADPSADKYMHFQDFHAEYVFKTTAF